MLFKIMRKSDGFTLMELLVATAILIVLGIALLISIDPLAQIFKGYDARRKSDLNKIKVAFEAYYSDHDCYPDESVLAQCNSGALLPYLNSIPCDPNTKLPYTVSILPEDSVCPQKFAVYADLNSQFSATTIPGCPDTYAVHSSNMGGLDLSNGCGTVTQPCTIVYGCKGGVCTIVANDEIVTCGPSSCDSDCGADCTLTKPDGSYRNECLAF